MKPSTLEVAMHAWTRLAARTFGGAFGRVPAVPEPERGRTDAGGGIELSWLRWPGPAGARPLVLLHGLNNNAWAWARVATLMRAERTVVAVSLRGHGRSTVPDGGWDLASMAGDVLGLLDAIAPGPVDLGGHSMGGKVACRVAAEAPGRVASLSLADPVPPSGFNPLLRAFPALVDAALRPERGPFPDRDALLAAMAVPVYLRCGDATDLRVWEESFVREPDGSYRHTLPEPAFRALARRALNEDITPMLAAVACPVLLLRPSLSVAFLPWETAAMRRAIRGLAVRTVPGDHTFIHTNPFDTAAAMRPVLEQ